MNEATNGVPTWRRGAASIGAAVVGAGAAACLLRAFGPGWLALVPPLIALACTHATLRVALRRGGGARYGRLAFGMLVPPVVVFAWLGPLGLLMGALAGLIAFVALLPLAAGLRMDDDGPRPWLVLAGWCAAATAAFALCFPLPWLAVPAACGLGAAALALGARSHGGAAPGASS
ncbi:MAG: hypothetical protein U1F43_37365 [Myxococcota bacterium]